MADLNAVIGAIEVLREEVKLESLPMILILTEDESFSCPNFVGH